MPAGVIGIQNVTNNGMSSLSLATTGSNGRGFWFLRILNTPGPSPSQHWALKLDCRPLWRFVHLPSLSSPSTKKKKKITCEFKSLLPHPQKWLSKPASRMEKLPPLFRASTVWSGHAYLKIQPFLTSYFRVWSLVLELWLEKILSASLHFYTAWLEQISLLKNYTLKTKL